jgi:hypothetical protein
MIAIGLQQIFFEGEKLSWKFADSTRHEINQLLPSDLAVCHMLTNVLILWLQGLCAIIL